MELLGFFAALCICSSILQTPCVCMQIQDQSSSLEQASSSVDEIQFSLPTLPRKLRALAVDGESPFKAYGDQVSTSTDKHKADLPGKAYEKKENKMKERRSAGTRQEWDRTEYFTMDYSHVRRRRPIHNKSLPVGP